MLPSDDDIAEAAGVTPTDSADRPLEGRRAWVITDGKAGMEVQCVGVAEALGVAYERICVAPGLPWYAMAPWGPIPPKDRFGGPRSPFSLPWPIIAIATGRQSIPYIRAIARKAGPSTYTVVIQDPRTGPDTADLIAVPKHDDLSGDSIISTLTAPHGFSPERLKKIRQDIPADIAELPTPRVTVILGGPNAVYDFGPEDNLRLAKSLSGLAALGASFLITTSRRTPEALLSATRKAIGDAPAIIWSGDGPNPYAAFLANADMLVVTADSVNMTGEACATGRPVYVFEPGGGSDKFSRFHEALRRYGATQPLPDRISTLDQWQYPPLDSAAEIAREIERRWLALGRNSV